MRLSVGVSGASGVICGIRLLRNLSKTRDIENHNRRSSRSYGSCLGRADSHSIRRGCVEPSFTRVPIEVSQLERSR